MVIYEDIRITESMEILLHIRHIPLRRSLPDSSSQNRNTQTFPDKVRLLIKSSDILRYKYQKKGGSRETSKN